MSDGPSGSPEDAVARVDAGSLYGTLNLLVLRTLAGGERLHGLDVQRRIQDVSGEAIRVEVGALYPALHRLERDGLLIAEWGMSDSRRRAKFYRLSPKGRKRLERERAQWEEHALAVRRVLGLAGSRDE